MMRDQGSQIPAQWSTPSTFRSARVREPPGAAGSREDEARVREAAQLNSDGLAPPLQLSSTIPFGPLRFPYIRSESRVGLASSL